VYVQESLLETTSLQFDIQASLALNHDTSSGLAVQQFLTHQERLQIIHYITLYTRLTLARDTVLRSLLSSPKLHSLATTA